MGNLRKIGFDVTGAQVEMVSFEAPQNTRETVKTRINSFLRSLSTKTTTGNNTLQTREWCLRIKPANPIHLFELGVETKEDAIEWCDAIK